MIWDFNGVFVDLEEVQAVRPGYGWPPNRQTELVLREGALVDLGCSVKSAVAIWSKYKSGGLVDDKPKRYFCGRFRHAGKDVLIDLSKVSIVEFDKDCPHPDPVKEFTVFAGESGFVLGGPYEPFLKAWSEFHGEGLEASDEH